MSRGRWSLLLGLALILATVPLAASSGEAIVRVDELGLVDPATGQWHLRNDAGGVTSFYFGNPGDYPILGDWDCDGVDTPGMYRQSDGYVYLRNSNTQGVADVRFFFGNPGDIPLAGDFNGNGCSTVSIYRPSTSQVFIINRLGQNEGGLGQAEVSYYFGDPGDKPFVGDFDGNIVETVGLHRESTGLVYFRNSHTQGVADNQFIYGDPGDRLVAGDWTGNGFDSPGLFRPSNTTWYLRWGNTQGIADESFVWGQPGWLPVAGEFGQLAPTPTPPTTVVKPPNPGDTVNCSDFTTWAEAQAWFDLYFPHYGDVANLDADGDGIACESLPGAPPPGATTSTTTTTTTTTLPPGPPCDITVTGLGDADGGTKQLREAITDVCDGGIIRVLPGTITLTRGRLIIPSGRTVTIEATDPIAGVAIDANEMSHVMAVETSAGLTLRYVTITGGYSGFDPVGAGIRNEGTLALVNSTITDNEAHTRVGGGIYNTGDLTVVDSVISDNGSSGGGGLYNSGTVEIRDSELARNGAGTKRGGGISNGGTITITGTLLVDNGGFNGGGVYNGGTITITDSAITGSTGYTGLGIYNLGGFVELNGSTTITGGSGRYAGGIYNTGTLVMRDATTVSGNVTENGGGMTNTGIVEMYGRSTIAGNTAFYGTTVTPGPGEGGGMTNSGTVELFDESSITGNRADNYGGGIYNTGSVTLWGTTTVTRNDAGTQGGGIYNDGGSLTILPAASVSDNTPDDIYNVP